MAGKTGAGVADVQHIDGRRAETGLVVYRASRLEALLEPLLELLDAAPPDDVLAPHTILAAHPGMRHWLTRALAKARGPRGIVANLDVLLPSSFIDRLAQDTLGLQAVSLPQWRSAQLRWQVFELLESGRADLDLTRLASYLDQNAPEDRLRRRFELADRLARLYAQYLVYRPDWLRRWERGERALAHLDSPRARLEGELVAPLWRMLKHRLGDHRADILQRLLPRLRTLPASTPLHVFGLNHAPPQELAVLRALADSRLVALYAPDPCREFWGGLSRDLDTLAARRAQEAEAIDAAGEGDWFIEQGHPLLARWGRLGQQFFMALSGIDEVREDVRHWQDRHDGPPANRLQRVQESLRRLDPGLLREDLSDALAAAWARADDSLRVHACHTRLRELEVLRDVLLDATGAGPGGEAPLQPGDIVVMAPDIGAYLPLIPAVFGPAGEARARLPYHLADISAARSHRLFAAFRRLLALPATRLSAPELIDLLQQAELARRFGLDPAAIESLADWLQAAGARWGLDARFRERFDLPALYAHSLAWGMDRLIAGYLIEDAAGEDAPRALALGDGSALATVSGLHGPEAEPIGALDALLQALQGLFDLAGESLPLPRWCERFEGLLDTLFRVDSDDAPAREAEQLLRQMLQGLAAQPPAAQQSTPLPFALARELLEEALGAVPERQPFLLGGITICGMVPQRAIPFGLVAVLGLNEGEFPRRGADGGLDLMRTAPRLYDREQRSDDRYLFLETVMSARQRLHLSYLGRAVKDGAPRNPAAPLAELLDALDAQALHPADEAKHDPPWRVEHPLQPFDPRYFDGSDLRLFSHAQAYAALPRRGAPPDLPPFVDPSASALSALPAQLGLRELQAFWRDPARQVLAQGLQLRLDALDSQRLSESEPLDAEVDARERLSERLFASLLQRWPQCALPTDAPAWLRLSGLLPPGRPGQAAWAQEHAKLDALLAALRATAGFPGGIATSAPVDVALAGCRIVGEVAGLHVRAEGGHWLLRGFPRTRVKTDEDALLAEDELDFRRRLPLFIDWAILRLATAQSDAAPAPLRVLALLDPTAPSPWIDGLNAWDAALCAADADARRGQLSGLADRMARLLDFWREGQAGRLLYLPRTSWAALCEPVEGKRTDSAPYPERLASAVSNAWSGADPFAGEADYGPGYARLLFGEIDTRAGSDDIERILGFAARLLACISFDAPQRSLAQASRAAVDPRCA